MTVKLSDIAERSKVSVSTVSRVLNNHQHVNEEKRRAVLKVAEELGYDLPRYALDPKKAPHVILVTMHERDPDSDPATAGWESFNHLVSRGAQPVLRRAGFSVSLYHPELPTDALHSLFKDGPLKGLLIIGGSVPSGLLDALNSRNVPFVIAGAHVDPSKGSSIMADILQGTRQVASHLVSLGRERIALINGPASTITSRLKADGWRLGLASHGMLSNEACHLGGEFSAKAGYDLTLNMLERSPDVDAVMYADDFMALGGLKALAEAGLRVPEDVAVVGFHDYPIATFTMPSLTTVGFDMVRMGSIAAHRLLHLLEGGDPSPWTLQLPTTLIVRRSTRADE